eukprot:scaffold1048_cov90-Amphora_coffeaeformis.AAC.19
MGANKGAAMLDPPGGMASGLSEGISGVSVTGLGVAVSSTGAAVGFCDSVVGVGDGFSPGSAVVGAHVSWLTGRGVGTPVSLIEGFFCEP